MRVDLNQREVHYLSKHPSPFLPPLQVCLPNQKHSSSIDKRNLYVYSINFNRFQFRNTYENILSEQLCKGHSGDRFKTDR